MRIQTSKKKAGFTLIELIVVLAVLGILALIAVPRFFGLTDNAEVAADTASLKILNTATSVYEAEESKLGVEIFDGISTDQARMQILVDKGLLVEELEPQKEEASFYWNVDTQIWCYSEDQQTSEPRYNVLLTKSDLDGTVKATYVSFEDYMKIWMVQESGMPIVNSTNGSLSWSSANYTGEYKTNLFQAKFWNEYFEYVGVPNFNATNSDISDFKVFFKRDNLGNITSDVAGVYMQIGSARSIYFSNGEVVTNMHYSSFIDSTSRQLVYP